MKPIRKYKNMCGLSRIDEKIKKSFEIVLKIVNVSLSYPF